MPDLNVMTLDMTLSGADPATSKHVDPLNMSNPRDALEYHLGALSPELCLAHYSAGWVTTTGGRVSEVANILGPVAGEFGIPSKPLDPASASTEWPTVGSFGAGKSAGLSISGTPVEPFTHGYQISARRHAIMTVFRITSGSLCNIIGHPPSATFAGVGVNLVKMATADGEVLRWYYNATDYLEYTGVNIRNKAIAVFLDFDADFGRQMYVMDGINDGSARVAYSTTTAGRAEVTSPNIQRFANNYTGSGPAQGLHGDFIHLDIGRVKENNLDLFNAWRTFAAGLHNLGT